MNRFTGLVVAHPLLVRWDSWVHRITKKQRIAIFHDADPDGVTSATLVAKMIQQLRGKKPDLVLYREESRHAIPEKTVALLKKEKITVLFTCDMALDETPETVRAVAEFTQVIMLDHHKLYLDLNNAQILMIKPQMVRSPFDPGNYSTAKLAFDLASRVTDMNAHDWIASIGIIGDMGAELWKPFMRVVCKKYCVKLQKNWFDTEIGMMTRVLSSAQSTDKKLNKKCFQLLWSAKKPRDILRSSLVKYKKAIEQELAVCVKNFSKRAEKHGDLFWFEFQPKNQIKGPLGTILGQKHKHNTILIVDTRGSLVNISARRSDRKIAVNALLEQAIKGLPHAAGGGHIPAAGATVRKQDLVEFKRRILQIAQQQP